jgi:hypothetical protein
MSTTDNDSAGSLAGAWPATDTASSRPASTRWIIVGVLVAAVVVGALAGAGVFSSAKPVVVHNPMLEAACNADAKTVETAEYAYDAEMSHPITTESGIVVGQPSTYALGKEARLLVNNDLLTSWPAHNDGYALSLSRTVVGDVSIYIPPTSTHPVSYDDETSSTGCNSL